MSESKNKINVKNYNTEYYKLNKAKILENALIKIKCEKCNKVCSKSNMNKHIKTLKHKMNVELDNLKTNKN